MKYCKKCGNELENDADFCTECGTSVTKNNNKRKVVFEGEIHKCPNCGEVLKSFETNCSACGFELNRKEINSSLKNFIEKIDKYDIEIANNLQSKSGWASWSKSKRVWWVIFNIFFMCIPLVIYLVLPLALIKNTPKLSKEEKQKVNLIENFSFPNDRESILAALLFAKEKVNFISNETIDRKSAYWLRLWNSKAEQLKQKADMLFPNDIIVKQSYAEIIKDGNKVNKVLEIKAIVGVIILIVAIIFTLIRYNVFENTGIDNDKNYNAKFEWQTTGLFEQIPQPNTNNGQICWETENQIKIELYNISSDDFNSYVKKCREAGFTLKVTKNDSIFYASDNDGYSLSIFYSDNDNSMSIFVDSYEMKNEK